MNKTINLENLNIKVPDLNVNVGVDQIHNNVSSIFTTVPIYEIIMVVVIFMMTIILIQRFSANYGMWKTLLVSSTLSSVFSFIMIYASLFTSYFTFTLSLFIWLISVIVVITSKK